MSSNEQLPPPNNEFLLVEHIDILIAALIGFLALFQLPRALVRLRQRSEWSQGHFFQHKARNRQVQPGSSHESDAIPAKESLSRNPTTSEIHAFYGDRRRLLKRADATQPTYPPHMPTYPAFLRPFAEYLSLSIVPGYSNLQALVMLAYLGILLYAFFYRSNNPRRSGIIAASQLPFLYAFASKNNVPGSLLGIGYQGVRCSLCLIWVSVLTLFQLNYFHRYIGCLVVLAVNVHAIGWCAYKIDFFYVFCILILAVYQFTTLGIISTEFKDPSNRWGLVTLICMDIIFVFSTPIVRARAYNLFRITHVVGYLLIVPAVSGYTHAISFDTYTAPVARASFTGSPIYYRCFGCIPSGSRTLLAQDTPRYRYNQSFISIFCDAH